MDIRDLQNEGTSSADGIDLAREPAGAHRRQRCRPEGPVDRRSLENVHDLRDSLRKGLIPRERL